MTSTFGDALGGMSSVVLTKNEILEISIVVHVPHKADVQFRIGIKEHN